jgi:hypothetical protein
MKRVFIIGGMKCGTTSVHHMLKKHPQVSVTTDKEPSFFSKRFRKGFNWYNAQFQIYDDTKVLIDVSPSYSMKHLFPHVTKEMYNFEPNAKIVYLVRDPLSRMVSHIHHDMLRGRLTKKQIDLWLTAEADCLLTTNYQQQIQPFIELYGKENVMVFQFENLIKNPQHFQDKFCDFIGLEKAAAEIESFNVSEQRYLIKYHDFIHTLFDNNFISRLYHLFWYAVNIKVDKPVLTEAQELKAYDLIKDDMQEFIRVFNLDESLWKYWQEVSKK